MRNNLIETIMGAVVLVVAGMFLAFALAQTDIGTDTGYTLRATFTSTGGLRPGNEVRINGVKVGNVVGQSLDPDTYEAVVVMTVEGPIRLPADTEASIAGNGLMGDKYIRLAPGSSEETIAPGGVVTQTKDYRSLEEMIGDIIFLNSNGAPGGGGGMGDVPDW